MVSSHLGLPGWGYIKRSWWILYHKAPELNYDPNAPNGAVLSLYSPRAPCLNVGKAVLQGVTSQSNPKDVGVDPPLSLEIPIHLKPSCPPLQESYGGYCW